MKTLAPTLALLLAACTSQDTGDKPDDNAAVDDTDTLAQSDSDTDDAGSGLPTQRDTGDTSGRIDTDPPEDTGPIGTTVFDITLTADDAWRLWIDGVEYTAPGQNGWSLVDHVTVSVPGQRHVVAVEAWDMARVITGFIARVEANHELIALTGDGTWKTTATDPGVGWQDRRFDDSAWGTETVCTSADALVWGRGWPDVAALLDSGAQWQWSGPCRSLGRAYFRVRVGGDAP